MQSGPLRLAHKWMLNCDSGISESLVREFIRPAHLRRAILHGAAVGALPNCTHSASRNGFDFPMDRNN
jgi:hypothetical protein